MIRTLATITLTTGLLLAGIYAFAQDPNQLAQPTFTRSAPAPAANYGLPSAAPVPYPPGMRTVVISDYQSRIVDDATQNRDRELLRDTNALVEKYGQAKEAKDKSDIEKELARVVADHFALRQDIREKELLDLEDQLKRLRKVHDQRSAEKDRIVTDRVQQLLRESSGLGWGTDANGRRSDYQLHLDNQFAPSTTPVAPRPLGR